MRQAAGDLWGYAKNSVLVITTNGAVRKDGACVMGRGIALEAAQSFPEIPFRLGNYIKQYGNRCFSLGKWGKYHLVSFPVKHHWKEEADIQLISTSARQLVEMADKYGWGHVFMPQPGCGNGRLLWRDVEPVLAPILDDRFIVCTFI